MLHGHRTERRSRTGSEREEKEPSRNASKRTAAMSTIPKKACREHQFVGDLAFFAARKFVNDAFRGR
jgi:hypothetical protein